MPARSLNDTPDKSESASTVSSATRRMCFCSIHLYTAADVTLRCAETSLTYWLLSFAPSFEPASRTAAATMFMSRRRLPTRRGYFYRIDHANQRLKINYNWFKLLGP